MQWCIYRLLVAALIVSVTAAPVPAARASHYALPNGSILLRALHKRQLRLEIPGLVNADVDLLGNGNEGSDDGTATTAILPAVSVSSSSSSSSDDESNTSTSSTSSSTSSSSSSSTSSSSAPIPSSSSSGGNIIDTLTSLLFPDPTPSSSSNVPEPSLSLSLPQSSSSSNVPVPSTSSSSNIIDTLTSILFPDPTPSSSSNVPVPSLSSSFVPVPSSSTSGNIIDTLTSILFPDPTPSSSSPVQSTPSQVSSSVSPPPPASSSGPVPSPSPSTPPNPISSIISSLSSEISSVTSAIDSAISSVIPTPPPPSSSSSSAPEVSQSSVSGGPIVSASSSSSDGAVISSSSSVPPVVSASSSSSVIDVPGITSSSSSDVPAITSSSVLGGASPSVSSTVSANSSVIEFPSGTITSSASATSLADSVSTSSSSISLASDLAPLVASETNLVVASLSSTTTLSLSNPDQPTTTVSPLAASGPVTTLSLAALPTGIPARIYPKDSTDGSKIGSGYSFISIRFTQELNWPFVVGNQISSSQIFAYLPVIIQTALGISADQVKTFALQVYIPSSYQGPQDATSLGTTWLGYIPSDLVDSLAAQIRARNSPFYIGVNDPVAQALAQRVDSGFAINSLSDPSAVAGSNPGSAASGSSSSDKARQDAIIGVVSTLGAIALLVLGFLIYRTYKRRNELRHRRLSDPAPDSAGMRPVGTDFDQDSIGGARRRSFYFAEDSLRQHEQTMSQRGDESGFISPSGVTQRRQVLPNAISAPVLQQSSMNW